MRNVIIGLLLLVFMTGCGAGLTADLMTYDNIIAAAKEAEKGVNAFNEAVITDTAHRQKAMLDALARGIKETAAQEKILNSEQADAIAQRAVTLLTGHLANYTEQERRRSKLYAITIDNLRYIIQISEQGKKFAIYRADVGEQWKQYLEASAKDYIGTIDSVE